MKQSLWVFLLALLPASAYAETAPIWAFLLPDANLPAAKARVGTYSLPGSALRFTQAQIDDLKNPPDWFPEAHPPAPRAVLKGGPEPFAWACGSCHLVSGMGHPESASLAGLPAAYMLRRMAEFRASPQRAQPVEGRDLGDPMPAIAKAWSEANVNEAVAYFAALKARPWVKVVETDTVPKSYVDDIHMRIPAPGQDTESLGRRIVELPQDLERARLRDPNSGTVAYVPTGAIARGKALVSRSALPCAGCHGQHLTGQNDVPGLAGRSPVYNVRQMYFFQSGVRKGPEAEVMKQSVAAMSEADMIDVAAYLASLSP